MSCNAIIKRDRPRPVMRLPAPPHKIILRGHTRWKYVKTADVIVYNADKDIDPIVVTKRSDDEFVVEGLENE